VSSGLFIDPSEDRNLCAMKFIEKTPREIVSGLVAQDIEVDSSIAVSPGFDRCASYFYDGHLLGELNTDPPADIVPKQGIILSTGSPQSFNIQDSDRTDSWTCSSCTDSDLQKITKGQLYDVCWIQFKFRCIWGAYEPLVRFNYVFGSDEYLEFVDNEWNDVFGLFLNGQNIAKLPNNDILSINTVNYKTNSEFFHGNDPGKDLTGDGKGKDPDGIETKVWYPRVEADGFTSLLEASGTPNTRGEWNTIKLVIADVEDQGKDSWVLLEGGSLTCMPKVRRLDEQKAASKQSVDLM
jgi:hypothetical protein